jgi:zinc transport system permease protein
MLCAAVVVIAFLVIKNRELTSMTFDRESAHVQGINVKALDLTFYILLAVSVVLGVKVLGVILVSALMIIPASSAKMMASSYRQFTLISLGIGLITVIVGMLASLAYNLPSGPAIILVGAGFFVCISIAKVSKILK